MFHNKTKEKLQNGEPVLGVIVNGNYPQLVEIIGLLGYDYIFIDMEHSTVSFPEMENVIRAAELRGLTSIVRVSDHNPQTILKTLDAGAQGLIVPHVNTKEQAEAVVRAAKFAPLGDRGLGSSRYQEYGMGKKRQELFDECNAETLVIPIMESAEALKNAEEIMQVEGVDGFSVGTSDLAMDMGLANDTSHPDVIAAQDKLAELAKKYGKFTGGPIRSDADYKTLIGKGINFLMVNIHSFIRNEGKRMLGLFNEAKAAKAAE